VCAVEIEEYPRKVLLQRQLDGILPKFPIWDDITTFDGRPWKGVVDVVCGGFPCQDISCAGKGAGIEGEKSGLWGEMARVINEVRPQYAFVENSPMLISRGLGCVLGDLAEMGYDAQWGVLGADSAGLYHRRHRLWVVAYSNKIRLQAFRNGRGRKKIYKKRPSDKSNSIDAKGWLQKTSSRTYRNNDGVANRVDRLKAIGNGQVPRVAELAWQILIDKTPITG